MSNGRKGHILRRVNRQVSLMLVSQTLWIALLLGFFAWWGHLLGTQARRIAELERQTGVPEANVIVSAEVSPIFAGLIASRRVNSPDE